MQGVWGAAGPPSGEREGRSPLACASAHTPAWIFGRRANAPLSAVPYHRGSAPPRQGQGWPPERTAPGPTVAPAQPQPRSAAPAPAYTPPSARSSPFHLPGFPRARSACAPAPPAHRYTAPAPAPAAAAATARQPPRLPTSPPTAAAPAPAPASSAGPA